jgi:hypothetical protein
MNYHVKRFFLGGLFTLASLMSAALGLGSLALLATHGLDGVKEAAVIPFAPEVFAAVKAAEGPALASVRARVPHVYGGYDISPWILLCSVLVLWVLVEMQRSKVKHFRWKLDHQKKEEARMRELEADRLVRAEEKKAALARMEREAAARADRQAVENARHQAELEKQRLAVEALKVREAGRIAEAARLEQAALSDAARRSEEARKAADEARLMQEEMLRQAEAKRLTEEAVKAHAAPVAPQVSPALQSGGSTGGKTRDELLELMAQAKKQLELQKKALSFLAIDVVNSTGMKVGEDPSIATRDFKHYRKLVEKAIADNNGLKAAWTPDGVMICFPTAETAVSAAKQVINDLKHFNAHVKAMRHDFKVRCGINTGTVLFDDTVPMEEMADRSIDIAGHMQKYAEADTIFIGKHVIEEMRTASDFQPVEKQVDGCDVYAWRSN